MTTKHNRPSNSNVSLRVSVAIALSFALVAILGISLSHYSNAVYYADSIETMEANSEPVQVEIRRISSSKSIKNAYKVYSLSSKKSYWLTDSMKISGSMGRNAENTLPLEGLKLVAYISKDLPFQKPDRLVSVYSQEGELLLAEKPRKPPIDLYFFVFIFVASPVWFYYHMLARKISVTEGWRAGALAELKYSLTPILLSLLLLSSLIDESQFYQISSEDLSAMMELAEEKPALFIRGKGEKLPRILVDNVEIPLKAKGFVSQITRDLHNLRLRALFYNESLIALYDGNTLIYKQHPSNHLAIGAIRRPPH